MPTDQFGWSRRAWLTAGVLAPWLVGCATDLSRYASDPIADVARTLGVCAGTYTVLTDGKVGAAVALPGCQPACVADEQTVFQAASLTKPMVALAALTLVKAGQLDLQAPLAQYLPDGYRHRQHPFGPVSDSRVDTVPPSVLARMTVAMLLNHSAGLPNWTQGTLAPQFEPGSRWQYSGEGYLMLQSVLCAVTGLDIESLMAALVWRPLGLRSTSLRYQPSWAMQTAGDHACRGGWGRHHEFVEPNAAASLYTTATDYATMMAAWLADDALMALAMRHTVATAPELGLDWGLGWGIEHAAGGPYLWQWGNNPGYRAFAMCSAASKNGFVLLTRSERGMPLVAPLMRAVIPAEHGVLRFAALG